MSSDIKNSFFSSDKNLYLRLNKHKDKEAFLDAYRKYANDLYRFLYFKVGNAEEAQDILSQVFLKAWAYVNDGKLKSEGNYKSLRAFLYKIARNEAIDYFRAKRTVSFSEMSIDGEKVDFPDTISMVGEIEQKADIEALTSQLAKLKTDYRSILLMYYVDELSVPEIAQVMGKTKGNIRVTIFRALKALKELVGE